MAHSVGMNNGYAQINVDLGGINIKGIDTVNLGETDFQIIA
jgi:hypothetical protein